MLGDEKANSAIFGSGWVWDKKHVVTNFHVINGISKPYVTFIVKAPKDPKDSKESREQRITLETTIIGADAQSDVAVLRVGPRATRTDEALPGELMAPLKIGSSRDLLVGQDVFAFGNPFGLEHSLSRGIISGVSRTMDGAGGRPISGIIQTDASINPGNSGGPLLDSDGRVIGMNTAILTTSGAFAGVGLATPIDTVSKNVDSIIAKGFVRRPFLGIVFAPDVMSEEMQLTGIMVMKVIPGGPAESCGVRPMRGGRLGDIVVGIDGKPVGSSDDLFRVLDQRSPDDVVQLTVQRAPLDAESDKYEEVQVNVKLGVQDAPGASGPAERLPEQPPQEPAPAPPR